jgi:hypothetical protein
VVEALSSLTGCVRTGAWDSEIEITRPGISRVGGSDKGGKRDSLVM